MYDKTVRRRRAALAAFVALSLVLLTAYFGESGGGVLHAVQRGAGEALAPLEEGVSRAVKPVRDLAGWTGDVLEAEEENDELRTEVERLRRDLARSQTASRDADELRALTGLADEETFPDGLELVTARVIAKSPTSWFSSIQINKGSDDGVRENQPVIAGGGLAGKVSSVTGGSAQVMLITDEDSAVSAEVMPDGVNGVVKAEIGQPDDLLLDFIEKGRRVRRGRTIVTSGFRAGRLESRFPRGIPIGKVIRVDESELELYQRVHMEPFADLRQVDVVQVVTRQPPRETAGVAVP